MQTVVSCWVRIDAASIMVIYLVGTAWINFDCNRWWKPYPNDEKCPSTMQSSSVGPTFDHRRPLQTLMGLIAKKSIVKRTLNFVAIKSRAGMISRG